MNKNDSERLASLMQRLKMLPTDDETQADVVIMNSCSVRQTAEDRIYSLVNKFAKLRKDKPDMIICVTGCMPGRDKDGALRKKLPEVDLFFPSKDMTQLPMWLANINPDYRLVEDLKADYLTLQPTLNNKTQAFLTIQTGCNHFCTYCVVPFSRGLEVNRPLKDILDEARQYDQEGYKEITLLGQIVNHYQADDASHFSPNNPYNESDFAKLLWEMNQLEHVQRIHWTAPHPIYMTDEVIDALTLPKQLNFIHLPVQSGNDEILRTMNRRHTSEFYIDVIKKIRAKKPDIAIGTDIIVGFCGETEEQFNDTVALYKACDFDISYTAKYSTRSGTLATKVFKDDVSLKEKKRRWWVLQNLMEEIVLRKNQQYVDKTLSVLVETCEAGWCMGNSREMKRVRFKGDESLIGHIVDIEIYRAGEWMMWGRRA